MKFRVGNKVKLNIKLIETKYKDASLFNEFLNWAKKNKNKIFIIRFIQYKKDLKITIIKINKEEYIYYPRGTIALKTP